MDTSICMKKGTSVSFEEWIPERENFGLADPHYTMFCKPIDYNLKQEKVPQDDVKKMMTASIKISEIWFRGNTSRGELLLTMALSVGKEVEELDENNKSENKM